MVSVWQDLIYGLRGFRKQPGFALLSMLTLAFGIGATTTIFSAIYGVLLNPFPYADVDRIVQLQIRDSSLPAAGRRTYLQTSEFLDYVAQSHVFTEAIGSAYDDVFYSNSGGTEQFNGALVTPNTFRFLGVQPLLGRGLVPEDAKPGAPPVFVMSYKTWAGRFHKDSSILGRAFILNNSPATLAGIMPPRFNELEADIWRPLALNRADDAVERRFWLFRGKLKPGVTLSEAQADIDLVARRVAGTYPLLYPKRFKVHVATWIDTRVGQFRAALYTMAAAVALLLLIACGNVANMLLARATSREKEMAIRCSVGAGRWQIVRLLLVESLLLALGGAAIGTLYAYAGVQAVQALAPERIIPLESVIELNLPVFLFSLGVAALTAILFGAVPALQTVRRDIVEPLRASGKGMNGGFHRGRLRGALVAGEVASSLVLLCGAGLLMRTFVALQRADLGFKPENVVVARLPLPQGQYNTREQKKKFYRQLLQRLHALPGVVAAAETTTVPPYGVLTSDVEIPGLPHDGRWRAILQLCSEGYFSTLRMRVSRGRLFLPSEIERERKVAVINRTFAGKYFGKQDPIGRTVRLLKLATSREARVDNPDFEVVGIVADAKNQGIQDPPEAEILIPYTITGAFERGVLVRVSGDPGLFLRTLHREVWAVDPNVAISITGPLADFIARYSYAAPRFTLVLLGVFAAVGLLLVSVGVYSTLSYTISRQTQEIGIRMAIGAQASDVLAMVLRMGMGFVGMGTAAGIAASLLLVRVLRSQLYELSPYDPLTFASAVLVVVLAGLLACWVPARRAVRVQPMAALRHQ